MRGTTRKKASNEGKLTEKCRHIHDSNGNKSKWNPIRWSNIILSHWSVEMRSSEQWRWKETKKETEQTWYKSNRILIAFYLMLLITRSTWEYVYDKHILKIHLRQSLLSTLTAKCDGSIVVCFFRVHGLRLNIRALSIRMRDSRIGNALLRVIENRFSESKSFFLNRIFIGLDHNPKQEIGK